jgi:hypothetical protein
MISKFEDLNKLFEEIDNNISEPVEFYVIGGAMMMYHGLKKITKDIDIIVDSKKEFLQIQNTLKRLKFTTKIPTLAYKQVDLSQIFIREDFRIDLFHKVVCKGFQLSNEMKRRAMKISEFKHLSVLLCSSEDVLLLKSFTERDGDIDDCLMLAQRQKPLDWPVVLDEVENQIKLSGNDVWITYIGERLDILEDRGLVIPIMKQINKLRESYFDALEKKLGKSV